MNLGPLVLLGGAEYTSNDDFASRLFDHARTRKNGEDPVLTVLPTASAYQGAEESVDRLRARVERFGVGVEVLNLTNRRDANREQLAEKIAAADALFVLDGSSMHLRSVLKDSLAVDALVHAWTHGAVVVGVGAGALLLGDPMVDTRGGAFTLGLGLLKPMTIIPHLERWTEDWTRRMRHLLPSDTLVAQIFENSALVRWPGNIWETVGPMRLEFNGEEVGVERIQDIVSFAVQ